MTSVAQPPPAASKQIDRFVPATTEHIDLVFRRPVRLKATGMRVPAGTVGEGVFGKVGDDWVLKVSLHVAGEPIEFLTRRVQTFFKAPTAAALEEASDSGTCETVLGSTAEPDGFDEEGSPSWLMALGLV